jgi:hypothetical protein
MLLDLQAARAVARAHVIERAVNDPGPWTIRISADEQPAVRVKTPNSVLFVAHFDGGADPAETTAWLCCRGREISSRDISPIREPFVMQWSLRLEDPESERVAV